MVLPYFCACPNANLAARVIHHWGTFESAGGWIVGYTKPNYRKIETPDLPQLRKLGSLFGLSAKTEKSQA